MSPWTATMESMRILPDPAPAHYIRELPILVIFPHSRCNCRCLMCDIWKIRQVREITVADLEPHLASLRELKVRWIVFSGGEPLMHSDLSALAHLCRREGIRLTLLTAGLRLERHAAEVAECMDDVIVSIDGPPEIHDSIRGVPGAYHRLERGIQALRVSRPPMLVHGRCTVQKHNFRHLRAMIRTAQALHLNSVSFLAADVSSEAFNRRGGWPTDRKAGVALDRSEIEELQGEIEALIRDCQKEIESRFISEKPEKLRRIALHFQAHLGQVPPVAPRCNAPWVSAVIESDGTLRPCFFHRPLGNLHDAALGSIINSEVALEFRRQLDVSTNPICRRCVCALFVQRETLSR